MNETRAANAGDTVLLEELGEGVLDGADGEAWLALLARRTN